MRDMDTIDREHGRLIILRALASHKDGMMNSSVLQGILRDFWINASRDWVHYQMRYLAEMGAVVVEGTGSVRGAIITDIGLAHVNRQTAIEGVKRPSIGDAVAKAGMSTVRQILGED